MTAFLKTLPGTVLGLTLLAVLTVFGYTGHLTPGDTYSGFLSLIGLVGVTGLGVLFSSQWANTNAIPHLITGVGIMAAVVVLGLHNIFTSGDIQAILGLVVTGTAGGGGIALVATAAATPRPVPTVTFPSVVTSNLPAEPADPTPGAAAVVP